MSDSLAVKGRAEHFRSARVFQTSTCSAIARASSTSMPRYLTVLSILVCPSGSGSPEISGPPIDQGSFSASQGMCAKQPRIQPDAADPFRYEARILPGGYVGDGHPAPHA